MGRERHAGYDPANTAAQRHTRETTEKDHAYVMRRTVDDPSYTNGRDNTAPGGSGGNLPNWGQPFLMAWSIVATLAVAGVAGGWVIAPAKESDMVSVKSDLKEARADLKAIRASVEDLSRQFFELRTLTVGSVAVQVQPQPPVVQRRRPAAQPPQPPAKPTAFGF